MTDSQWAEVWHLFQSTQTMTPDERSKALGLATLTENQLAEIRALLELSVSVATGVDSRFDVLAAKDKTYLPAGEAVGRYTIVHLIGEGGFGQVYAARDRDLRRDVAVKLLYSSTSDSVAKALQEARAASALNHPNILTVYETIEYGNRAAIVTEFVAGHSLRQMLLNRKVLPLTEALPIARQVAAALQEAHSTGILHRDIKPENVLVRQKDGLVKLVDFGLAIDATEGHAMDGMAGTMRYSAPEQLSGKAAMPASDVFALAIVIYEMVAGVHPFRRETPMEAAVAILASDAPIAQTMPKQLGRLLLQMLNKDPAERPSVQSVLQRMEAIEDTRLNRRRKLKPLLMVAGLLLCLLSVFAVRHFFGSGRLQLSITTDSRLLTGAPGQETFPAISPHGRYVVYQWKEPGGHDPVTIVRSVETDEAITLNIRGPFTWLPDGHRIGFLRRGGTDAELCTIDFHGADQHCLFKARDLTHFAWSPDGEYIVYSAAATAAGGRALFRHSLRKPETVQITFPPAGSSGDDNLAISADSRRVAFRRAAAAAASNVFELDLRHPGEPKQVSYDQVEGEAIAWLQDGSGLITSSMHGAHYGLWLYDLLRPTPPVRLTEAGVEAFSVSIARDRNQLAWTNNMDDSNLWSVSIDADKPHRVLGSKTRERDVDWSTRGVLAYRSDRSGYPEIWIAREDGREERKVTNLQAFTGSPRWSPDGRSLVFDSLKPHAGSDLFLMHCEPESLKCGQPVQLTSDPANDSVPNWSADGRYIYFGSQRSGNWQIWRIPADGGQKPLRLTYSSGLYAMESRDGKWLYYSRVDSRETMGVWRKPTAGLTEGSGTLKVPGEFVAPMEFRSTATWVLHGEQIYFSQFEPGTRQPGIWMRNLLTGRETLVHAASAQPLARGLSVSQDGRSIVYSQTDNTDSNVVVSKFSVSR